MRSNDKTKIPHRFGMLCRLGNLGHSNSTAALFWGRTRSTRACPSHQASKTSGSYCRCPWTILVRSRCLTEMQGLAESDSRYS